MEGGGGGRGGEGMQKRGKRGRPPGCRDEGGGRRGSVPSTPALLLLFLKTSLGARLSWSELYRLLLPRQLGVGLQASSKSRALSEASTRAGARRRGGIAGVERERRLTSSREAKGSPASRAEEKGCPARTGCSERICCTHMKTVFRHQPAEKKWVSATCPRPSPRS